MSLIGDGKNDKTLLNAEPARQSECRFPATGFDGHDGSTELTYGLGLKYDFSSNLGLRLEWQRFTPGGYLQPFGEGDGDLLSGGLRYRF